MRKYRIVIVENDEDEQFFMREGFDKVGSFDILAVLENGNTFLEWMQEQNELPELILSDLNMPGKNGYDIIHEIKASPEWRHIPVIITSTSSTKIFIDKCLEAGATGYLVKPESFIDYPRFVENLYRMVEEKKLVK